MNEQEFWSIMADIPEPKPIFYRAYYNESGLVEVYTMEDLPGNYIEVDQATYVLSPHAKVINNKLCIIVPSKTVSKLVPSDIGTTCHPNDVCVVVSQEPNIKWSLSTSESN